MTQLALFQVVMKAGGVFLVIAGCSMLVERVVGMVSYMIESDDTTFSTFRVIANLAWYIAPLVLVAAGLYLFLGGARVLEMAFGEPPKSGGDPDSAAPREESSL